MERIEWRRGLADSPAGRLFGYAFLGSLTGLGLLIGLLLLLLVPVMIGGLPENLPDLALVLVFVLVGGPLSLLALWPLLTDPDQRRPIVANTWLDELSTRGILVAAVAGAGVHLLMFVVFPISPLIVVVLGGLAGSTGTWILLTEGYVDPDERTLYVRPSHADRDSRGTTIDLDTWTGLARYRLGPVVLLRPTYAPGVRGKNPRLVPVPAPVAEAATPIFERALATSAPTPGRPPNPVVAATLVLFGLGAIAVGVAFVVLEVGPPGFRLYLLALGVLFGGLFLLAAKREY